MTDPSHPHYVPDILYLYTNMELFSFLKPSKYSSELEDLQGEQGRLEEHKRGLHIILFNKEPCVHLLCALNLS